MKTFILLITIMIALASCRSPQQIADRKCAKAQRAYELASYKYGCPWKTSDTVTITNTVERVRDTTVYVPLPGDSVRVTLYPVDGKKSILHTKYAMSAAWVEKDSLHHELTQLQSSIPTSIAGAIREKLIYKEKTVKVPFPVEKKVKLPLSWIQKFAVWSGVISWGLLITFVLYKFRRFITFPSVFN